MPLLTLQRKKRMKEGLISSKLFIFVNQNLHIYIHIYLKVKLSEKNHFKLSMHVYLSSVGLKLLIIPSLCCSYLWYSHKRNREYTVVLKMVAAFYPNHHRGLKMQYTKIYVAYKNEEHLFSIQHFSLMHLS